jgi:hypothetical protein
MTYNLTDPKPFRSSICRTKSRTPGLLRFSKMVLTGGEGESPPEGGVDPPVSPTRQPCGLYSRFLDQSSFPPVAVMLQKICGGFCGVKGHDAETKTASRTSFPRHESSPRVFSAIVSRSPHIVLIYWEGNLMRKRKKRPRNGETNESQTGKRLQIASDDLPRRTLADAVELAKALNEQPGGVASFEELCIALKIGGSSTNSKYLLWAAVAYGIINKQEQPENAQSSETRYTLAETGSRILKPENDAEAKEAKIKALLTPKLLSRIYTDFNGKNIPTDEFFPNILERRYQIPTDRFEEVKGIILENAEFAGVLDKTGERPRIVLGTDVAVSAKPPVPEEEGSPDLTPSPTTTESDWDKVCFYITPIGDENSEVRKHSDMMLKHLVESVATEHSLKVIRADKIEKSGLITQQVFEHLVQSRLCIADLSFSNPNVFYELGVRHMALLPTIQLIRKGDKLPFDVSQGRTIVIDTSDVYTVMDKFTSARKELAEHVRNCMALKSGVPSEGNPVATYLPELKVTIPKPSSA